LRTRIDIQLYPNRTPEDVKVLLAWPSSGGADWQTGARAAQAAGIVLRLADASLPAEREGELAIFNASTDQIAAAMTYLDKAAAIAGRTPVADGLKAITAAIGAYQTSDTNRWKDVSDLAASALANSTTAKDSPLANRRPAVQFVAAFAAARLKDNTAAPAHAAALATFSDLLNRDFPRKRPHGRRRRIALQPGRNAGSRFAGRRIQPTTRDKLAAIWIAKGRLLERDDNYALIGPAAAGESKDSYARTILRRERGLPKKPASSANR